MVRDTDQTAYAGRALGGYHYPHIDQDGKEALVTSSGSPRRLATKVSDVRTGEVVTEQVVGAYVDPANPNLLHAPHTVMRLDQSSCWRLATADSASLFHGPVAGLHRKENVPGATNGETGRVIMATRHAMEQAADTMGRVEQQQREMADRATRNQSDLLKNQSNLLKLNNGLGDRMTAIEKRQAQKDAVPASTSPRTPLLSTGRATDDGRQSQPITAPQTVDRVPPGSSDTRSGVYDGATH